MRHGACRAIGKLRGGEHLEKIQRLLDDPDFDRTLKWACESEANMKSERGRKLRNQLVPLMTMTGKKLPWSPGERAASRAHITHSDEYCVYSNVFLRIRSFFESTE